MKIIYPYIDLQVELCPERPAILSLENAQLYTALLENFLTQTNGDSGELLLVDGNKELNIEKEICLVTNPLLIDCNERRIITQIYTQLRELLNNRPEAIADLNSHILTVLDQLLMEVPYNLDYDPELDLTGLFKIYNVRVDTQDTNLLERIFDYIRLQQEVNRKSIFVFIGLKEFFDTEALMNLYELAEYNKFSVVIIEGRQFESVGQERNIIVDQDQCVIEF